METDPINPYAPPKAALELPPEPDAAPLADRGVRLGAAFLDGIVLNVVSELLTAIIGRGWASALIMAGSFRISAPGVAAMVAWVALNAWLLQNRGQTVGKWMTGIKIVLRDGQTASIWRLVFARQLPIWAVVVVLKLATEVVPKLDLALALVAGVLVVGNYLLIFRKNRACLHDDLAGTKVVKVSKGYRPAQDWSR